MSWQSLIPWFKAHGATDVRFKAQVFEVTSHALPDQLYRLIAGQGPWI